MLSFFTHSQENSEYLKNTYLCIAEKTSFIEKSKTEGINARAGLFEKKYIITPDGGLKEFGNENVYLDKCHYMDDGRPNFCESSSGWTGEFLMDKENVFLLSGTYFYDKEVKTRFYWHIGKCSILY